jgi:tetratricopeptide (TPR) repeat protein
MMQKSVDKTIYIRLRSFAVFMDRILLKGNQMTMKVFRFILLFVLVPVLVLAGIYESINFVASAVNPAWQWLSVSSAIKVGWDALPNKTITQFWIVITMVSTIITTILWLIDQIVKGYIDHPIGGKKPILMPIQNPERFPFIDYSTNQLDVLEKLYFKEEYASLMYLPRYSSPDRQEALISRELDHKFLLVTGRTGLGKTRECIELFRRLAEQRGEEYMILSPRDDFDRPSPYVIPAEFMPRNVILFIDGAQRLWSSPTKKGTDAIPARDFYDRLAATIEWMKERCDGGDIRVVLTAQGEPEQLKKIRLGGEGWSEFKPVPLSDIHKEALPRFIRTVANHFNLIPEPEVIEHICNNSDGTPAGIINVISRESTKPRRADGILRKTDIQKYTFHYPQDWEREVYDREIGPYASRHAVFQALSACYLFRVPTFPFFVVDLAARLYQHEQKRWYYPVNLWLARKRIARAIQHDLQEWMFDCRGVIICQNAYTEGRATVSSVLPAFIASLRYSARERDYCAALLPALPRLCRRIGFDYGHADAALTLLEAFTSIKAIAPKDLAPLLVEQSVLLGRLGRHPESLRVAEAACKADPQSSKALVTLAYAQGQLNDPQELETARKATEVAQEDDYAWLNFGVVLSKKYHYMDAALALERACKLNPKNAKAYYSLGLVYDRQGQRFRAKAIDACQHAVKLDPTNEDAWQTLGIALDRAGKHTDAIEAFISARPLNDGNGAICFSLARALYSAGKDMEGRQALKDAESRFRKAADYNGLYDVSACYINSDRNPCEAFRIAQEVLHRMPNHKTAKFTSVICLKALPGRSQEAKQAQEQLHELCCTAQDWLKFSSKYREYGYYQDARDAAEHGITIDPSSIALWREKAMSCEQNAPDDPKLKNEAVDAWNHVDMLMNEAELRPSLGADEALQHVKSDPYSWVAWKQLATAYRTEGRTEEAVSFAIQSVESTSDIAPYCVAVADVLLSLESKSVVPLMERLVGLDSTNSLYFHFLGVARYKSDDLENAVEPLSIACRLNSKKDNYFYALGIAQRLSGNGIEAEKAFTKAYAIKPSNKKAYTALRIQQNENAKKRKE